MTKAQLAVVVLGGLGWFGAPVHAGPTARFGLTGALADQSAPGKYQLAPLVALGMRGGAFVGELEYSWLSFFDPDTTPGGVHRLGVTLRADLVRQLGTKACRLHFACTRSSSFYGEVGAAERFGRWQLDSHQISPTTSPSPELHVGLGLELDNTVYPRRDGWQLGVRFAVARRDEVIPASCRGASCTTTASTDSGLDKAVFVEWMFMLGD